MSAKRKARKWRCLWDCRAPARFESERTGELTGEPTDEQPDEPKTKSRCDGETAIEPGPAQLQGQGPLAEPGGERREEIGERSAPCPVDSSAGGRSPLQLPKSRNPRASPLIGSLYFRSRAIVAANLNKRPGGADDAPGPAPKDQLRCKENATRRSTPGES
jgi:hypothetical protein